MVLILLSLFGNIMVCVAVYHSRHLRARVNYLIVSLAIADIIIASIAMPLWMAFELTSFRNMSHETSIKLMKFQMFIDILGGIASITNLVAISFERLWSVFSPLNHRKYLTNFALLFMIVCAWVYAIFVAATTVAWYRSWDYVILYNAIIGFFFPLFLIMVFYLTIFVIVNRSPRTVVSAQDNFRINLTIYIIIGLFVICWAPHFIFSVLHQHCESCYDHLLENLWYRSLSQWLHYANSCVNPIVYGIANAQYKEAFKSVLKKICLCCFFDKESTALHNERLPALFYPNGTNNHDKTTTTTTTITLNGCDKLRVELEPDEKECNQQQRGAVGTTNPHQHQYLPGDYRALPMFPVSRTRRWASGMSTTTTETYFPPSLMETTITEDENAHTALITPPTSHNYLNYWETTQKTFLAFGNFL